MCPGHHKGEINCAEPIAQEVAGGAVGLPSDVCGHLLRWSLCSEKNRESEHLLAHPGNCVCSTTVLQSMKLGVDVNRHKEVIVKAVSAVLLLLLKHFKLNHIYQVPAGPCVVSPGPGPEAVLSLPP